MNETRRLILFSGGIGVAAFLSGCLTPKLYEHNRYTENVSSILISQDKKKVAVIGKDYHYLFNTPDVVVRTLGSSFYKEVDGGFEGFYVKSTGKVHGNYTLTVNARATELEKNEARAAGYEDRDNGTLQYRGTLVGDRYSSGGVEATLASQRLNNTYNIRVEAEQTTGEIIGKTVVSPITLAADGLLVVAAVPLFTFIVVACIYQEDGCK